MSMFGSRFRLYCIFIPSTFGLCLFATHRTPLPPTVVLRCDCPTRIHTLSTPFSRSYILVGRGIIDAMYIYMLPHSPAIHPSPYASWPVDIRNALLLWLTTFSLY
ncbi:hypothetical protein OH76DRAFT_612265 [Lentinus brumalis]|uniref:Secreted protein n=1 Tax=Lentinus brumalis TaxID=2498619 RepID=A0A371DUY0_9APHY|nr:hypothetical protein OH76DRAFT_612265 [Polyporus brumalis]